MKGRPDVVGYFFSPSEIAQAARRIKIKLLQIVLSIFSFRINFCSCALGDLGGKLDAGIEIGWRAGQRGSGKSYQKYQSEGKALEHGSHLRIGTTGLDVRMTKRGR